MYHIYFYTCIIYTYIHVYFYTCIMYTFRHVSCILLYMYIYTYMHVSYIHFHSRYDECWWPKALYAALENVFRRCPE